MKNNLFNECIASEEFLMISLLSGDITWQQISNNELPYNFLINNKDSIIWAIQSAHINDKASIECFKDYIDWDIFCSTSYFQKIVNNKFLKKYRKYISWQQAIMKIEFTDNILKDFFEEIYTGGYLHSIFNYGLADRVSCECLDSLTDYFDNLTWKAISTKMLDEWFIEKYSKQLNWKMLSRYQRFSESFMKNNVKNIKWNHISDNCLFFVTNDFIIKYVIPNITDVYKAIELYDLNIIKLYMFENTHLESVITYIKNRKYNY